MLLDRFYKNQVHFLCRFCGAEIGHFKGDDLIRNASFQQALVKLSTGQFYSFNGCVECVKGLSENQIQDAFDLDPATPEKGHAKILIETVKILKKDQK